MGKYNKARIGEVFNQGNLVIMDSSDKKNCVKVKCNVCANDFELHGDATYEVQYSQLALGKIPCGCSIKPLWSIKQYEILVRRKILVENLPVEFVRFLESTSKVAAMRQLELRCKVSEENYIIANTSSFLRGNGNFGLIHTVGYQIKKFNDLNDSITTWDTGKRASGGQVIIGYHCGICESSGHESVYTAKADKVFTQGQKPCLCSNRHKESSSEHLVDKAKSMLINEDLKNISVIGAIRKGIYNNWSIVFLCQIHGVYSKKFANLQLRGCYCKKCNPSLTGYKSDRHGYLYILEIQTQGGTILGYGITNKLNNRLTTHRKNLKSVGATITNIQVFEGSGTAVLAIENAIKSLHTTGLLDCGGFRRESISIDRKYEVLELCKKLKVLDNVKEII